MMETEDTETRGVCRHCGERITLNIQDPRGPYWFAGNKVVCEKHVSPMFGRLNHEPN